MSSQRRREENPWFFDCGNKIRVEKPEALNPHSTNRDSNHHSVELNETITMIYSSSAYGPFSYSTCWFHFYDIKSCYFNCCHFLLSCFEKRFCCCFCFLSNTDNDFHVGYSFLSIVFFPHVLIQCRVTQTHFQYRIKNFGSASASRVSGEFVCQRVSWQINVLCT